MGNNLFEKDNIASEKRKIAFQPAGCSRFNNYDMLRILSTVAVIFIHVNWHFFSVRSETPTFSTEYLVESIINIITRFSVPSFVMISGAFNLRKEENGRFSAFYKKAVWKIFIPVTLAIVLFFFYDVANFIFFKYSIYKSVKGILLGSYYNLWFIYMLAGLYLVTPFVIKLKSVLQKKNYIAAATFLLIWAVVSQAVSKQQSSYAIGVVFAFLGYYLMGDVILNCINLRHNSVFYFAIAGLMFILTFIARFNGITFYLSAPYTNFFSPFITAASICIFAGVKGLHIKKDLSWLAGKTFYLYVFHAFVYNTIFRITARFGVAGYELLQIFVISAMTFGISLMIALVYNLFWESKDNWKSRFYSLKIWNIGA